MSNRKSQNSILFLATLGVYLGLVLAGATPVLGHAATSRQFDIRDEFEFADELDNKPDGETAALSISIKTYLEDVEFFLGSLSKLHNGGKFDVSADRFEVTQTTILPCVPANKVGSYTADTFKTSNESLRPSLERFSKLLTDGYSLADCLPGSQFQGEAANSRFTFKLDGSQFSVEFGVKKRSPEIARMISGDLAAAFARFKPSEKDIVRSRLFENTSFRSDNDQVFVITRFPRAGLEPLLANDAK
ncbi:MAG: hypothetical protein ACR2IH_11700 [Pyrinomonadaceae bacterium]